MRFWRWLDTARITVRFIYGVMWIGAVPLPFLWVQIEANDPWRWTGIVCLAIFAATLLIIGLAK